MNTGCPLKRCNPQTNRLLMTYIRKFDRQEPTHNGQIAVFQFVDGNTTTM